MVLKIERKKIFLKNEKAKKKLRSFIFLPFEIKLFFFFFLAIIKNFEKLAIKLRTQYILKHHA